MTPGEIYRKLLNVDSDYRAAFVIANEILPGAKEGSCSELVLKNGWFLAYNPHLSRTETTRGQLLEAGAMYIEDEERESIAMFGSPGGYTMSGVGPRGGEVTKVLAANRNK